MSAEIHILGVDKDQRVATGGQPDPNVVAELEWMLEAARAGRIAGIAYVVVYSDHSTGNRYVGVVSQSQVGGLFAVMGRVSRELSG